MLFNLISVDVAFIGTRTLLHSKIQMALGFYLTITLLLYTLMLLDIIEVAWISGSLVFKTQKRIKGWKETQKAIDKEVANDKKKQEGDTSNESMI